MGTLPSGFHSQTFRARLDSILPLTFSIISTRSRPHQLFSKAKEFIAHSVSGLCRELQIEAAVGPFFPPLPFNAWQRAFAAASSPHRTGGERSADNKCRERWGQTLPLRWDKRENQLGPATGAQQMPLTETKGAGRRVLAARRKQKYQKRAPVIRESPAPSKASTCWAEQRLLGEAWKRN